MPSLNQGRWYHSLTPVAGGLVAAGGWVEVDEWPQVLDTVEIYRDGVWTTANWRLAAKVSDHCAVGLSGTEVMIVGGRSLFGGSTDRVTVYNIDTGAARGGNF